MLKCMTIPYKDISAYELNALPYHILAINVCVMKTEISLGMALPCKQTITEIIRPSLCFNYKFVDEN